MRATPAMAIRVAILLAAASLWIASGCSNTSNTSGSAGSGTTTPAISCTSSGDCKQPTPYCDTARKVCAQCTIDANCSNQLCDTSRGVCVDCRTDQDCQGGHAEGCDRTSGRCGWLNCEEIDPGTNEDQCRRWICTGSPGDLCACDPTSHLCVECESDADCNTTSTQPHCDLSGHLCAECVSDADCAPGSGRPYCYKPLPTTGGVCAQCLTDKNCPAGQLCNQGLCS